jgi:hypothetical protein
MINEQINDLELRISELEIEELLKKCDEGMKRIAPILAKQRGARPAGRTQPGTTSGLWTLRTTRQADGTERHELRSAAQTLTLPKDRSSWPAEARKAIEGFEAIDRRRSVGGRLVSSASGSAKLS